MKNKVKEVTINLKENQKKQTYILHLPYQFIEYSYHMPPKVFDTLLIALCGVETNNDVETKSYSISYDTLLKLGVFKSKYYAKKVFSAYEASLVGTNPEGNAIFVPLRQDNTIIRVAEPFFDFECNKESCTFTFRPNTHKKMVNTWFRDTSNVIYVNIFNVFQLSTYASKILYLMCLRFRGTSKRHLDTFGDLQQHLCLYDNEKSQTYSELKRSIETAIAEIENKLQFIIEMTVYEDKNDPRKRKHLADVKDYLVVFDLPTYRLYAEKTQQRKALKEKNEEYNVFSDSHILEEPIQLDVSNDKELLEKLEKAEENVKTIKKEIADKELEHKVDNLLDNVDTFGEHQNIRLSGDVEGKTKQQVDIQIENILNINI